VLKNESPKLNIELSLAEIIGNFCTPNRFTLSFWLPGIPRFFISFPHQ